MFFKGLYQDCSDQLFDDHPPCAALECLPVAAALLLEVTCDMS